MMTSLLARIHRGTNVMANKIGHALIRLTLLLCAAVVVTALGSMLGLSDHTPTATPAPVAAPAAVGTVVDTPATPAPAAAPVAPTTAPVVVGTSDEPSSDRPILVGLRSTEVSAALWNGLVEAEWVGHPVDGTDQVIYAPAGLVFVDEVGTWKVTLEGAERIS